MPKKEGLKTEKITEKLDIEEIKKVAEELAPLELSYKTVAKGDYDNSGIILNFGEEVKKILFSLDLSVAAVKRAKRLGANAIVTHHPAIYYPVKSVSERDPVTNSVALAARNGISVLSMHLNLDIAEGGIDASLAEALGAKSTNETRLLDVLEEGDPRYGYGREFPAGEKGEVLTLSGFAARAKKKLKTNKAFVYGKKNAEIKVCASFCGAGAGYAEAALKRGALDADVVLTADMPHHILKELVEAGKCVIIMPHYAIENYGFEKFYRRVTEKLGSRAETFYFEDGRFL